MSHEYFWKKMADKQQEENIQRIKEEELYKEKMKRAYMNQLSNQLKLNQEMRKKQKDQERQQEKELIHQGIKRHQDDIHRQELRNKILLEREELMEREGKNIQMVKKQEMINISRKEKIIQKESNEAAQLASRLREEEQLQRKKMMNNELLEKIQQNRAKKKLEKEFSILQEKAILSEGQNRKLKEEMKRVQFYHDLREKAKVLDYGSHEVFEQKFNKRLLDKKKQQWSKEKEALELNQRLKKIEENSQKMKIGLEQEYRSKLKNQMEQNQLLRKEQKKFEIQNQKRSIQYADEIANRQMKRKMDEEAYTKKQLAQILKMQANQNMEIKNMEKGMNRIEEGMNKYFLNDRRQERRSIDTFQVDYLRKRQFATIEKSLNLSSTPERNPQKNQNYFARRGVSLLE